MASRSGIRNYRLSLNFFVTPAVQWLIIANVAVYIFEILLQTFSGTSASIWFVGHFGLVPSAVFPGLRIWQPLTYMFLHEESTIWHILSNMFMLYMFGRELELAWGRDRFLQYYFLTGIGAGIFGDVRTGRRQYQPHLPPRRHAGGLRLFAPWFFFVQRAQQRYRLEDAAQQKTLSGLHEQAQRPAIEAGPLGELKADAEN